MLPVLIHICKSLGTTISFIAAIAKETAISITKMAALQVVLVLRGVVGVDSDR